MFDFKKIFGKYDFGPALKKIGDLEEDVKKLTDEELRLASEDLKQAAWKEKTNLDAILPRAYALAREAARRKLGQRHYDVQLIGGIILHEGKIAEMKTGEGKTLAATAPVYLNALTGKGVHIVTVNDYLAKRDAVWMGQIYDALGISVSCLVHETAYIYDPSYIKREETRKEDEEIQDSLGSFKVVQDFLRPVSRKEAYAADVVYGTNHEFGFDYLRDNLAYRKEDQVQRGHYYAIVDEIDSILIDEARTPLIISAPDIESSEYYKIFASIVPFLEKDTHYAVDEKARSVSINDEGITKIEKSLSISDLYSAENSQLVHYLEESLKAYALFHKDKQYVVKNGEIIIVDEFTGRMMHGRRYSGGLHQAIEAKEKVKIQQESRTFAQITIQNYFRLYEKISGMTGTAQTSAEEFHKVYNLEVATVPTNKPNIRVDMPDLVYKSQAIKFNAVVEEVKKISETGRPVLLGTASIENNEILSALLSRAGVRHQMLNAKNHEKEAEIIAQAGRPYAVTVATNMAGRGVDIILGGNPPTAEEAEKVRALGGLHVIGTDRHESRRIDNQLRGRTGRQGDPGSSQFFLSLEDDLIRVFGGDRIKTLLEKLNFPETEPIESKMISRAINEAQKKVEGINFDSRKHLLEYDDVLNKQRTTVYKRRQEVLEGNLNSVLADILTNSFDRIRPQYEDFSQFIDVLAEAGVAEKDELEKSEDVLEFLKNKIQNSINSQNDFDVRLRILVILDRLWMTHLENLDDLRESVRIRAYGQHDPLIEYRRESYLLFQNLVANFEDWVFYNIFAVISQIGASGGQAVADKVKVSANNPEFENVGRNDPCPCGAKHEDGRPMKYKHCHGK